MTPFSPQHHPLSADCEHLSHPWFGYCFQSLSTGWKCLGLPCHPPYENMFAPSSQGVKHAEIITQPCCERQMVCTESGWQAASHTRPCPHQVTGLRRDCSQSQAATAPLSHGTHTHKSKERWQICVHGHSHWPLSQNIRAAQRNEFLFWFRFWNEFIQGKEC